jgi:hypothetical protein
MVSRQAIITAAVAIVMLVIGIGIGYGAAGSRVTTVTSPVTLTFYTPVTTTATVREVVTMYTFSTVTRMVTATVTQLQPVTVPITVTQPLTVTMLQPVTVTVTITPTTPTPIQRVVEAVIRQVVQVGPWRLAVLDVKEATYIKTLVLGTWSYYQAPEGMKIVIVTLRIENTGMETRYPFGPGELGTPVLVTDANKSYDKAYTYELKSIYEVSKEIEEKAIEYKELDIFTKVAPGSYVEGDIMFLTPQTEKPAKLVIEYWPSPFEPKIVIVIKLS